MIKNLNRFAAFTLLAIIGLAIGCKKSDNVITIPPYEAHFTGLKTGSYFITSPTVTYKVPIGVTTVSNVDRTIAITVTSNTGAVLGTHYTLSKTSAVIPAGKAVDSIEVKGVQSQYLSGRKDTLLFTIQQVGDVTPLATNATFKLLMRGPCFEGDVDLTQLLGAYTKTNEDFGGAYGPYTTTISQVVSLTATTGTVKITNIFDAGWNPIVFTLDWTNPAARTVTLIQQAGIGNAGTISSTYAGQDISVRPLAGQVGTFSICNQTLVLKMQLGVTGLGFFSTPYTVNMAR